MNRLIIPLTICLTIFALEFIIPGTTHKLVNEIQWIAKAKK